MNDRTGEIREMTPEMAERLNDTSTYRRDGFWVPIPEPELPAVQGMNRAQRRAWAKQQRKGGKQ